MKIIIAIAVIVFIIFAIFVVRAMRGVEEPKYEILSKENNIEIRKYSPMIVAEVEVSGERKEAIQKGFRLLADYIFGNNQSKKKIAMTAPVESQLSEKIAMTAPVTQQQDGSAWRIRFVMPEQYSMETLPKPNSLKVKLIPIPSRRFVVIRFSGIANNASIEKHTKELEDYVNRHDLNVIGPPVLAFYNPPWTPPFLRRNEVMLQLEN